MRIALLLALLVPSFSFATGNVPAKCDEEFFSQFREKAAIHLCQISLAPNCQPPKVGWDKNNRLLIHSLSVAAGTASAEALQVSVARDTLRTVAFGKALDSGSYLASKLYGFDIYEGVKNQRIALTRVQKIGRMGSGVATFAAVYFYQSDDPAHCNEMLSSSYMTMKIEGGVCRTTIQMSDNVVKFTSLPLEDQVKAAADFPVVCEFYQKLNQKVEKDLDPKTRLIDFTCENGKPKTFTAALGEPEQKFMITPVAQGTGHLIGFKASSMNGPVEELDVRFRNSQEIQKPKSDPKRTYEVMKAWWNTSAVVTGCCDGSLKATVCTGGVNVEASPARRSADPNILPEVQR